MTEQAEAFDIMMKDLSQVYPSDDKDLKISNSNIRRGQICAAQFLGIWHRAEIVSDLLDGGKVKVFFVDFGTTATMDVKLLRYLLKPFANLPGQIYRGALSSIRPLNSHRWSRDSTYFMLSLVMDIVVQAKVSDIDHESQVVSLFLIDTNNNIDVHINNEMIIKGCAMAENHKWLSQVYLSS